MTWLMFSTQPLRLSELAAAVSVEPGKQFELDQIVDAEVILEVCGSFIRRKDQSDLVEFAHISVSEYFATQQFSDGDFNADFIDKIAGHRLLLKSCFTSLLSAPALAFPLSEVMRLKLTRACGPRVDAFELVPYGYSIFNWRIHAKVLDEDENSRQDVLLFLGRPEYQVWAFCFEKFRSQNRFQKFMRHNDRATNLYYQ